MADYHQKGNGDHHDIEEIHINGNKRYTELPQRPVKPGFESGNVYTADDGSSLLLRPQIFHDDLLGSIQIYSLWMRTFSKDKNIADHRWGQFRKSAKERYESFERRLKKIENDINISQDRDICIDISYIEQRKENIETTLMQINKYDTEFGEVSKIFEQFCQFIPKEFYRNKVDNMMRNLRERYFAILQDLHRKKQILRWIIPRFRIFVSAGTEIKNWLDLAEPRCEPFISFFNNNTTSMLENKEVIEEIADEIYTKKTTYEDFMGAGKGILGIEHNMKLDKLQDDIDEVQRRWDYLCANIEKCLCRIIKEEKIRLAELEKKTDTEKIDIKLKDESQLCTCSTTFKMTKVGEGKYTFGTTKTIRLLRIHGNSIVVRVGGGWEYLYNFLLKVDPCRAKQLAAQPDKAVETIKNLSGISLIPTDSQESSYTMSVQRMHKSSYVPVSKMKRTFGGKRTVSVDQLDSCGESFSSLSMSESSSTSSIPHTIQPKSKLKSDFSPRTPVEKTQSFSTPSRSHNQKVQKTTDSANKKRISRRVSLIERQSQYARKRCSTTPSALEF